MGFLSFFTHGFGLGLVIGFASALLWEIVTCRLLKIGHHAHKKGWHFHHSLFGPGALIVLPFFTNAILFVGGLSVGLVLQHVVYEDFSFITRSDRR